MPLPFDRPGFGLRAVALLEAAKGLLVLAAGSGLLLLINRDVEALALIANLGIVGSLAWALSRRQQAEVAAANPF